MSQNFIDDRPQQSTLSVGSESNRTADREAKTLEGSDSFADDRDHGRGETSTAEQTGLVETGPDRDESQGTIPGADVDESESAGFAFSGEYEADPTDPDVWVCPKCDSARSRGKWEMHGTSRTGYGLCPECWKPTPTSSLEAGEVAQ